VEELDTLEKHVAARGGRFDLVTALAITDRLLVAVARLHAEGIVHRDLQPTCVRITSEGRLEIVKPGSCACSAFAAPEQRTGGGDPIESRSDLYSVGLILRWMLTGHVAPMERELEHFPMRVGAFLAMAVSPIARRRFATAGAMRRAVLELLLKYGRLRLDRE
jgi:serine/threonine protein kinase